MALQLQLRRGNANVHASFIGAIGEITFDTSNNTVRTHDGSTPGGYEHALKSDIANLLIAPDLSGNTTNDLAEGNANLYFTNDRVVAAITAGENITIESNGMIIGEAGGVISVNGANGIVVLSTANIAEDTNLYFTNVRALAAVEDNLQTTNVIEGANLYFTNTRAVGALIAGTGMTIEANGMLISTAVANTGGTVTNIEILAGALIDVTGGPITSSGNVVINVDLSELALTTNTSLADQLVVLDSETADQYKIAKTNIPLSHFNVDLTTANIAEGANLYFTNDRVVAALTAGDNITVEANGLIVGADQTFTGNTDSVAEGATNLYFTNTRAVDAVTDNINTSNVTEGANLYFTNDRALAAVIDNINTSNVTEGDNLYFTNTRAVAALTAGDDIVIEANGLISSTATGSGNSFDQDLNTSNNVTFFRVAVTSGELNANTGNGFVLTTTPDGNTTYQLEFAANGELTVPNYAIFHENIYGGTTRNRLYLGGGVGEGAPAISIPDEASSANTYIWIQNQNGGGIQLTTGGGDLTLNDSGNLTLPGDLIFSDATVQSTAWTGNVDTSNVTEGANLYFTNARAVAAVQDNVSTSNITEGANLYFTNDRVVAALTAGAGIDIAANGQVVSTIAAYTDSNVETYLDGVAVSILPDSSWTRNLGGESNVWNNVWVSNIIVHGTLSTPATGTPTLSSDTSLNLTANDSVVITSSPFQLASFTWAEIQNIVAANGMMLYNTTNTRVQAYANGYWVDLHGTPGGV